MRQGIGHEGVRDPENGAPFNGSRRRILRARGWKAVKQLIVRIIVPQQDNVSVAALARSKVDVVKLLQVIRGCSMDGRAE